MAIGDRIRIITEEEYRTMSPPRRPRGEKPATTIRYLKRQIANLQASCTMYRNAVDDKEKVIAGYDVQLSEAQDIETKLRRRIADQAGHCGDLTARLRLKSERLAFLEGYYARSQETIEKIRPISAAGAPLPSYQANTYASEGSRDPQNLSAGRQRSQGPGIDQGPPGVGARLGDPVWRQHPHDISHPEGRAVEHVEIGNGISRARPRNQDWSA
jgi:hypothetical protein